MSATGRTDLLPNFTQAPNVFFDFWMADLERPELLVLLYLIRQTYGFHRGDKGDRISVHQFAEGKRRGDEILCRGTGLPERKVKAVLSLFRAAGLVIRTLRKDESGSSLPSVYRLNVDWDWREGMAHLQAIRPQVYGRGGSDPEQGGGVTLQTPPPTDEIEVVVQPDEEGDSTDTLEGDSTDTPPLRKKERKAEIKDSPPSPPLGGLGAPPQQPLSIYGGLGGAPSNNTAKRQRSTPRAPAHDPLVGAKGGEVAWAQGADPAAPVPAALPLRGVVAGGEAPGPPCIERDLPGAKPPDPLGEGAAAPQEDDITLTEAEEADIARFTQGVSPSQATRLRQMFIEGKRQSQKAKGGLEGAERDMERWVPITSIAAPVEPAPRPVISKSDASASGLVSLDPRIDVDRFTALASQASILGEIVFWGIEKDRAGDLITRYGEERVREWMTKAETKKDPAAYLMAMAKLEAKKRRQTGA